MGRRKNRIPPLLLTLLFLTFMPLPGKGTGAQERRDEVDIMIQADLNGTLGLRYVTWDPFGMFVGTRYTFFGPRGPRELWTATHAATIRDDDFLGYSRERYLGLQVGLAFHDAATGAILFGGPGIVMERRFREYRPADDHSDDAIYHISDRATRQFRLEFTLGVYHLGERFNLGMAFGTATRSVELMLGLTFDRWILRFGR